MNKSNNKPDIHHDDPLDESVDLSVGNREYKSDVFSLIMCEPAHALSVYNALNGTRYEDESLIQIKRLDSGIQLSMRNDASFIIRNELQLYEHQSTYNRNMPLRGLLYYAGIIKDLIKIRDLYGKKLVRIPKPHFVVFYNGPEACADREVHRLSDAYYESDQNGSFPDSDAEPDLEVKCTLYNINIGHNEVLLNQCAPLNAYAIFVEKVRRTLDVEPLPVAIDYAINYCIENGYLPDFFTKHRRRIEKVAAIDMTFERRMEINRRESFEDGMEAGRKEGFFSAIIGLYKDGTIDEATALSKCQVSLEEFKKLVALYEG